MKQKIFILGAVLALGLLFVLPAQAAGNTATYNTNVWNINRMYKVYEPDACENKECPVLFMFHGLGGSANQVLQNYKWQETADQNEFLVVFPESLTIPTKSVWGIEYDKGGKHWDIANIGLSSSQRYTTQDTDFVLKMVNELKNNYNILESHIFASGHSYGAMFSYYLATSLPDTITAFAAHSGGMVSYWIYDFPVTARRASEYKTPGIVLSSTGDQTVQHQWSINLINELKEKGQVNSFVVLDEGLNHRWDHSKNQTQWDFFMTNSPGLPEPPPPEPSVVNFVNTNSNAVESAGKISVNVKLDSTNEETINLNLAVSGSAEQNADYTLNTTNLTFLPGELEKAIVLTVLADEELENDETIVLNLSLTSGNTVLGNNVQYTHTIIDDTVPPPPPPSVVNFATTQSSWVESGNSVAINIELDSVSAESVVLEINTAGTAQENLDYTLNTHTITFQPGELAKQLLVDVIADQNLEANETIVLNMSLTSGNAVLGENNQYIHTIIDDTVPPPPPPSIVNFATTQSSAVESAGEVSVHVKLDSVNEEAINLNLAVSGYAQQNIDYTLTATNLSFLPGELEKTISIAVLTDEELESNETVILNLNLISGNAVLGNNVQYTHTIVDDTVPPPPPAPEYSPVFLTALRKNIGVIWQKIGQPDWALLYDYGAEEPKLYDPFFYGPYGGYTPLDVEVSWRKPNYFWWTMWQSTNGTSGLWRRDSGENDSLNKYTIFANNDWQLIDFALNNGGRPFVLWQNNTNKAIVQKYNAEGVYKRKYVFAPPKDGWTAERIVMDRYNKIRLLWVNENQVMVQRVTIKGLVSTWTPIIDLPSGYTLQDFEIGWWKGDQANRFMLVNGTEVLVWKVSMSGVLQKNFSFTAPEGYLWQSMETTSNNRINLMLSNSETGTAQVWKIHHNKGKVESKREYNM